MAGEAPQRDLSLIAQLRTYGSCARVIGRDADAERRAFTDKATASASLLVTQPPPASTIAVGKSQRRLIVVDAIVTIHSPFVSDSIAHARPATRRSQRLPVMYAQAYGGAQPLRSINRKSMLSAAPTSVARRNGSSCGDPSPAFRQPSTAATRLSRARLPGVASGPNQPSTTNPVSGPSRRADVLET